MGEHINYNKIQNLKIEIDNINFVEPFDDLRTKLKQVYGLLNLASDDKMAKEIESMVHQLDGFLASKRSPDDKGVFNGIRNKTVELLREVH